MERFEDAAGAHEVIEGRPLPVTVGETDLLLVRRGGTVFAVSSRCTHAFADLGAEGRVEGETIVCERHGARFELATGRSLRGDCPDLPTFPVEIRGNRVLVAAGD